MTFRRTALAVALVLVSGLAGFGALPNLAGAAEPPVTLSASSGPAGTSITVTLPSACTLPTGAGVSGGVFVVLSPQSPGGSGGTTPNFPMNPGDTVSQVTLGVPTTAPAGHYTVRAFCSVFQPPAPTVVIYGPAVFEVTGGTPLPSLTVSSTSGPAGTVIDVSGACAPAVGQPQAVFDAVLFSGTNPNVSISNQASGSGPIMHTTLTVPATFPPGSYFIAASCYDYATVVTFAESPFTVQGDAPPSAALSVTPSGTVPLGVAADASASTDTDATPIATYTFDWGDGTAVTGPQSGATALHTYTSVGTFPVKVTVTDTATLSGSATQSVQVKVQAPPCGVLVSCFSDISTTPSGTASATSPGTGGAIGANATGVGAVTVGRYLANPVGPLTFNASGAFFDVAVSKPNSFTTLSINDCDLQGGTTAQWWNPNANGGTGAWLLVSNQSFTLGPPACIRITVNATTSPSLTDLSGTVFAIAAPSRGDTISLGFSGAITYANQAALSSGDVTVSPHGTGPISAVTGTGTIPGAQGGNATVTFSIRRFFGVYVGTIRVVDPGAHLDQLTMVLTKTLSRVGTNGARATSPWFVVRNHRLRGYTLRWSVIDNG